MEVRRGYKQTAAGVIPGEWDVMPLGRFVALQRGHDLTDRDRRRGDVPVMGSAGLNGFHDTALVRGPGVVLGRSGASFGQAHYCKADFWPHNTALYVTDFFGNHPLFAFYFLEGIDFSRHNSGGAQQSLNRNFIAPIIVAIPKRAEQEAIAEALSDADAVIESLEQLLAKKRELKQGAMQELLTGRRRLPGFGEKWIEMRLRDLLSYERPDEYIVQSTEYLERGDTPVLTANKSFVLGYTAEDFGVCRDLPAIVFDDFTTASKYVDFPFKVKSSAIKLLRSRHDRVDLRFMFERMQRIRFQPGDHKRYYISEFQNLELDVPDHSEQVAIASVVRDMNAAIIEVEAKLAKTRQIRLGMMQELLTGRIRLV